MSLRRGFKSDAERIAKSVRREMRLRIEDRLDPFELVEHRGMQIVGLEEYGRISGCSDAADYFLGEGRSSFSAVTLVTESARIIIYNERNAPTRQASDIMHEVAHELLGHEASETFGRGGCRNMSKRDEAEADWLCGALLAPRDGLLKLGQRGLGLDEMAAHLGISTKLCQYRRDATGVRVQLERARRLRSRR